MSVIPLKADIHQRGLHVRFVPKADIGDRVYGSPLGAQPWPAIFTTDIRT
jgi:hypothetical protein